MLSNKFLIFWYSIIIILYFYINLSLSIISCVFCEDGYIYFGVSLSTPIFSLSLSTASGLICGKLHETFIILSAVLLPTKLLVVSASFWIALFEPILSESVTNCLTFSKTFWLHLLRKLLLYFCRYFYQKTKSYNLLQIFDLYV